MVQQCEKQPENWRKHKKITQTRKIFDQGVDKF